MTALLEIANLRVRYPVMGPLRAVFSGAQTRFADAVFGVSLAVKAGSTLAIVGESGSGKSSLANAVMGLVPVHSGSIRFKGEEIGATDGSRSAAFRKNTALIFQDPVASLSPRLTVRALVTEPLVIHNLRPADLDGEARRLLAIVGLPPQIADRYPHQLSGGQARRVGIARALALSPEMIIADEPTAGLDVSVQGEILNLLTRLQGDLGLTFLIITHNLAILRHISDEIAVMYLGRVIEAGRSADVLTRPGHHYTRALLAAQPQLNPDRRRDWIALSGEAPNPMQRPTGCDFSGRCAMVQDLCRQSLPPYLEKSNRHFSACHYPPTEEDLRER